MLRLMGKDAFKSKVPEYVVQGLNPSFELREYQKEAIGRLIFYDADFQDKQPPAHLLFHMATGSGKTLIMAAGMLYLYERGYRDFVFFVNSTNIIEKTKENFLNAASSKYLFAGKIVINAKEVKIRAVDNFEECNPDEINIHFTTIQGLHTRLNNPKENSVTYEDIAGRKLVLISDEAHHINALTRNTHTRTEEEELQSWEGTVRKIFAADRDNMLLEFTATVELEHQQIREKYEDKILYQYSLKEFRQDGFSKDIEVLQTDLSPLERALQALVLSQYRRKVGEKNGIPVKPVILFKSKSIAESEEFEKEFHAEVSNLNGKRLSKMFSKKSNPLFLEILAYLEEHNITLDALAEELKEDFSEEKCITVNSKNDSEAKQITVNTLEDASNEARAVFAVDMLNEGWDVLNLFDIVRLYETRDAHGGRPGKTTVAEAQLIGRGARYYPFAYGESQDRYKRKFDEDASNSLRILEELHYHSSYSPRYIQELKTALIQTGILPEQHKEIKLVVKDAFKNSPVWKKGMLFVNKRIHNERADILSIQDAQVKTRHKHVLRTGYMQESVLFGETNHSNGTQETVSRLFKLSDFGGNVVRCAMNRIPFYSFQHLQSVFPHAKSLTEFTTITQYLGSVEVEVQGTSVQITEMDQEQKLSICTDVLQKIAKEADSGVSEYEGTILFEPIPIKDTVIDKTIRIAIDETSEREIGIAMSETTNTDLRLNLKEKGWYVYQDNFGTSEEKYLVKFLNSAMESLEKKYENIHLIRNEKLFQLFRFEDGKPLEPDFVLLLTEKKSKKEVLYQLFIEPKGGHLIATDQWKEDFLREIERQYQIDVVFENKEFKLYGMPFYNEERKSEFEEVFRNIVPV